MSTQTVTPQAGATAPDTVPPGSAQQVLQSAQADIQRALERRRREEASLEQRLSTLRDELDSLRAEGRAILQQFLAERAAENDRLVTV